MLTRMLASVLRKSDLGVGQVLTPERCAKIHRSGDGLQIMLQRKSNASERKIWSRPVIP